MRICACHIPFLALLGLVLFPMGPVHASPPPADSVHFCAVYDYEKWRRDHPRPAAKRLADLNVGEPRTVRMIYFLPNDRPFRQEVVDSIKVRIRQVQSFYAEQMQAHGYGRRVLRIETDAQGEPLVHRVDGQHPDLHYLDDTHVVYDEIEQIFDLEENIYLIVVDNSIDGIGLGGGRLAGGTGGGYKKRGRALVPGSVDFRTVAHEIGHAFGLGHDFRSDAYIMSYGRFSGPQLSPCTAEFLEVHPYFNADSSLDSDRERLPTAELVSSPAYTAGTTSVPIRIKVADSKGLHQVTLLAWGSVGAEIKTCRGLSGQTDTVVEFEYDGNIPSGGSLSDRIAHPISVTVVNSHGDVGYTRFVLSESSPHLISTLVAYTDEVNSVSFSPDGTLLAIGSGDRQIILWDVATRNQIASLQGHADGVNSVSFSPDGTLLATVQWAVILWDVETREQLATFDHSSPARAVSFSPDGTLLAIGRSDGQVVLWDVETRNQIASLQGHADGVNSVSFSPDGTLLAIGSGDRQIILWDVATRNQIASLPGTGWVSVSFSPDGTLLATGSGSGDGQVILWDVETREQLASLQGHTGWVGEVSFSPDGTLLATGSGGWNGYSVGSCYREQGRYVRTYVLGPFGVVVPRRRPARRRRE